MQPVQFSVMYSGISAPAFFVAADDALVEVVDVEHGEVDELVLPVHDRAIAVIVERIAFVGLVHRGLGGAILLCDGHIENAPIEVSSGLDYALISAAGISFDSW
jgi:hypothetical protein